MILVTHREVIPYATMHVYVLEPHVMHGGTLPAHHHSHFFSSDRKIPKTCSFNMKVVTNVVTPERETEILSALSKCTGTHYGQVLTHHRKAADRNGRRKPGLVAVTHVKAPDMPPILKDLCAELQKSLNLKNGF